MYLVWVNDRAKRAENSGFPVDLSAVAIEGKNFESGKVKHVDTVHAGAEAKT